MPSASPSPGTIETRQTEKATELTRRVLLKTRKLLAAEDRLDYGRILEGLRLQFEVESLSKRRRPT